MIDEGCILRAVATALQGEFDTFPRVVWGNQAAQTERPYVAVMLVRGPVLDDTLTQGLPTWTGFLMGNIVTRADGLELEGMTLAKAFGDIFAGGSRFDMDDGHKLLVNGQPQAIDGYRDGADYRQPVRVPITTEL